MMKFIFWLFNSPARHWREINTYHKGAWGRVLTAILLPLICAGATVGLTYLSCKQFGESFGIGVLVALFAVAFFLTTIEYGACLLWLHSKVLPAELSYPLHKRLLKRPRKIKTLNSLSINMKVKLKTRRKTLLKPIRRSICSWSFLTLL